MVVFTPFGFIADRGNGEKLSVPWIRDSKRERESLQGGRCMFFLLARNLPPGEYRRGRGGV